MYHWIRDCIITDRGGANETGSGTCAYIIYHFLRTMGWGWLWECDGDEDNHCADASMEAAGTTSWTAVGTAVLAKDTGSKHMGAQSLAVVSSALNDGVQSVALLTMTASVPYYLVIYAANNTASSWEVEVDDGSGSFVSVGSIPANGGTWTKYEFTFTTDGSANPRYFRVLDNNGTTGTIYLDSVICWQSFFEHNGVDAEDLSGSPDGQIVNPDEFSSVSYTFVVGDVGKHLCVWDATNVGNSGVYEITGINAGNAVLDLRATAGSLVSQTGLRWRMCDTSVAPRSVATADEGYSGWGLQSPHSQGWRFFCRLNYWIGTWDWIWLVTWSAPVDSDFDVETGEFYAGPPSSSDFFGTYLKAGVDYRGAQLVGPMSNAATSMSQQRIYLQTDDDGTALFICLRPVTVFTDIPGHIVVGYTGADTYHTLRESFVHFGRAVHSSDNRITSMQWLATWVEYSSFQRGAQCSSPNDFDNMITTKIPLLGIGSGDVTLREYTTNARINPFSSERYLAKFRIMRDYHGYEGRQKEKTLDTLGLWSGELIVDADYAAVDTNTKLHFINGVYMELPESGGVGLFTPLP